MDLSYSDKRNEFINSLHPKMRRIPDRVSVRHVRYNTKNKKQFRIKVASILTALGITASIMGATTADRISRDKRIDELNLENRIKSASIEQININNLKDGLTWDERY